MKTKKLWHKTNKASNLLIEAFETNADLAMDQKLIPYDVKGSLAHAKMLKKIGIFSKEELEKIELGLQEILNLYQNKEFVLQLGDEDIHTKIENYLTNSYGEVGKKIHTGRSRNDQVLTAIRLYTKAHLEIIEQEVKTFNTAIELFIQRYETIPMPGYTHMQKAMPSSIALWAGSIKSSLQDDLLLLQTATKLNNQSPLGSAAGYGVSLPLDREYTAELLGFEKVQENPLYCQNSRGKVEGAVLASLISILQTINKFASDVLLFTTSEFNYFAAGDEVTTGSSIMPQKKNVDLAELLRSKVHVLLANYTQIVSISSNLISGYNRDLQDTKKPLVESLEITIDSIKVSSLLLKNLTPNKEVLEQSMTEELYATEKALQQVAKGKSFRDAYQEVGKKYDKGGEEHE